MKTELTIEGHTTLYIKNMVCNRCIKVVREEFEKINLNILAIQLGEVKLKNPPADINVVKEVLMKNGFQLLEDKNIQLIEKIKTLIVQEIHHSKHKKANQNFSEFLALTIGKEYHSIAQLFSSVEGITIEKYIILQKIERVKELLIYNENTISEIAYQLGYSSVAHLSSQFKNVIGMTPTEFKNLKNNNRTSLDLL